MPASIAKRVGMYIILAMIYIVLATIIGVLFTVWAEGKWDTPTFLAFFISALLLLLAPTPMPNSNSTEEVASSTVQSGEADRNGEV